MSRAYYNEINPFAVQWLRNLIDAKLIADGDVDDRSITDVKPTDLAGYTQCHFFAGIGGWSYALRLAGWPDDRPVFSGSCPCQPFSVAGTRKGTEDDRHLWPYWYELIRQCKPPVIFGEQVENAVKWGWLDLVQTDLEREDYATAAAVLPACSIGAPHLRKRLWFVGYADSQRLEGHTRHGNGVGGQEQDRPTTTASGDVSVDDAKSNGLEDGIPWVERQPVRDITGASNGVSVEDTAGIGWGGRCERVPQGNGQPVQATGCGNVDSMADTEHDGRDGNEVRRSVSQSEAESGMLKPQGRSTDTVLLACQQQWGATDWLYCRDEKWRPVKSGLEPMAHGLSNRVEVLRAYGNAIVPQVGAMFIKAAMECMP